MAASGTLRDCLQQFDIGWNVGLFLLKLTRGSIARVSVLKEDLEEGTPAAPPKAVSRRVNLNKGRRIIIADGTFPSHPRDIGDRENAPPIDLYRETYIQPNLGDKQAHQPK